MMDWSDKKTQDIAWKNASSFETDDPHQWKVCYICYPDFKDKFVNGTRFPDGRIKEKDEVRMKYDLYNRNDMQFGWVVDHIDGNKSNNDPSNLVAVHCDCANLKHHADYTEQFKRYKKNSNQ